MSNFGIVRRSVEALNRADWDAFLREWAPDAILDWRRSLGLEARVFRGHVEIRDFVQRFRESFSEIEIELVGDPVEFEEETLVVENFTTFRGRDGIEAEARGAWLITFRDGEQTSLTLFQSMRDALNFALVRMLMEKFKAGDHDVFEHYDPDIEWDATRGAPIVPEIANLYHGHDGVRAYWREWLSAWQPIDDYEYSLVDAGESVVVLIDGQRNRGRHSGIEVEIPPYALVFTMRDRKVVRWAFYANQDEALEAVGAGS